MPSKMRKDIISFEGQDIYLKRFFSESHDPLLFFPTGNNFSLPSRKSFLAQRINFHDVILFIFLYQFSL